MSLISQVKKPERRAVIGTICGEAGMGKTLLAASFPKPVFIRSEDGMESLHVDSAAVSFPVIGSVRDLKDQLMSVLNDDHEFQTLVIDSATELEPIFNEDILSNYNDSLYEGKKKAESINTACGGYGAGLAAVGALHQSIVKACRVINAKRGMNVIFIAHAAIGTKDMPDEDPYSRYTLQMNEKYSMPAYINQVDFVGYIKHEMFVRKDELTKKSKVSSDGTRFLDVVATPSSISKNRYGITERLPFKAGENPLLKYIPHLNGEK